MKLYKLIIVDDERFTLRTLADAVPWNKYGFETKCFVSPEEAIGWAEENFVDAVITDVNMPIINGNEMMERIRKIYPDVVFAVLSGYDEFIYAQKALQLGAIDYIIKPIGFDAIEALCKKIYERLNKNEADEKKKILSKVKEIMRNAVVGIKPEALYNMQFLSDNPVAIVHCNNEALKEYLKSSQYTKDDLYRAIDNIVLFNDNNSSNIWMRLELNIGDLDFISIKLFQNDDFQQSLINEINMIKNDIEQFLGVSPGLDIVDTYDNIQAFINEQNKISEHDDLVQKLYKLITEESADTAHEAIQSLYDNCINSKLSFKKAVKDVLKNFGDIIDVSSVSDEQAFALLMNHIENNIRNEGNTERNKAVLRRFKKYIDEHYMEDLSLDDIAGYMHMSPSYFSKYIKKLCGEKYIDYLISVRLEHAGKLLLEEDCTVSRLYEKVGFRSSQNFYRMFNRYYGCTPKEYRERCLYKEK